MRGVFLRFGFVCLCAQWFFGCPGNVGQPIVSDSRSSVSRETWRSVSGFEKFVCHSGYECIRSRGCDPDSSDQKRILSDQYRWKQVVPHSAKFAMNNDGFDVFFKWSGFELDRIIEGKSLSFRAGQAWFVRVTVSHQDFASVKTPDNPFVDIESNLPCVFKSHAYASVLDQEAFSDRVAEVCGLSVREQKSLKLYELKKLEQSYMLEWKNSFTVGSFCPERIEADRSYFIRYRYDSGSQKTTMVDIRSLLVEDALYLKPVHGITTKTSIEGENAAMLTDCPYVIGATDIQSKDDRHQCGRLDEKIWINRVCVPTALFEFVPGVDTANSLIRSVNCFDGVDSLYDRGDEDGWFDKRTHTYDVGGNKVPITNNLLLHGTNIGDCADNDNNTDYHTGSCGWYNIGQIDSGRQCFWKKLGDEVMCFYDVGFLIPFFPAKFLETFYEESKRDNNYPASFDRIGRPINWVERRSGGFLQVFDYGGIGRGAIMASDKNPSIAIYVGWPFWDIYSYRFSHGHGVLGFPISKVRTVTDYMEQLFENGLMRKYHRNGGCVLAQVNKQAPQSYCHSCNKDTDCQKSDTGCSNNRCVETAVLDNGRKKCMDSFMCLVGEVCDPELKVCVPDPTGR